jgi:hypothetical protein
MKNEEKEERELTTASIKEASSLQFLPGKHHRIARRCVFDAPENLKTDVQFAIMVDTPLALLFPTP